jgi:molybdenum cofactor guanylyltransferase
VRPGERPRCDAAAVLCGGRSRRAGLDKQTLPAGSCTLPVSIARLLRSRFAQVLIVTNRPVLYEDSGFEAVEDSIAGSGPLGGIHAALMASASDYAFVIAGDMIGPNLDYIDRMRAALDGRADAVVTRLGGGMMEPLHSFFSIRCAKPIEDFLAEGGRSVGAFLRGRGNVRYVDEAVARSFSPDLGMFANINTRAEVETYMRRFAGGTA